MKYIRCVIVYALYSALRLSAEGVSADLQINLAKSHFGGQCFHWTF